MPRPAHWTFVFLISCGALVSACDSGTEEAAELDVEVAASTDAPQAGELVTLTGSVAGASGGTLTYAWTFGSRPTGSAAALSNPSSRITTFVPDEAGRYVVSLEVSDGEVSGSEDVVFTVEEAPPVELAEDITEDMILAARMYTVPEGVVISVADGAQLTIQPGARIVFGAGAGLRIEQGAALTAIGIPKEAIRFVGAEPRQGFWKGIVIYSDDTRNELDYTLVADGGGGSTYEGLNARANIALADGARLTLRNSTVADSREYGLIAEGQVTLPRFHANAFVSNSIAGLRIAPAAVGFLDTASRYAPNGFGVESYVEVSGQNITTDTVMRALDASYRVVADLSVLEGLLTIEPGVRIVFDRLAGFQVLADAAISAVGTADEPITLTNQSFGNWRGMVVRSDDPRNELTHVEVTFGGCCDPYPGLFRAGNVALAPGARLTITNSTLRASESYGLVVENGAALPGFANNTFRSGPQQDDASIYIPVPLLGALDVASSYGPDDDGIEVGGATITEDLEIKNLGVPYRVSGLLNVYQDALLTLAPGVEMRFNVGIQIESDGAIRAVGTEEEPISLVGQGEGTWKGVAVYSSDARNELSHVEIARGGNGFYSQIGGQANVLLDDGARVAISNSSIRDSEAWGVWLDPGADLAVDDETVFSDNTSGDIGGK